MKYRKKPIEIEAIQFDGGFSNTQSLIKWCEGKARAEYIMGHGPAFISIETLEGTMTAGIGDWIIKGVNGEFYPCKPDIFAKTYEAVEAAREVQT